MSLYSKKGWIENLHNRMEERKLIVGAGVDSLEAEKCCDETGCQLILLYPTEKYHYAKNRFLAGFLAFGNTNDMMVQMAKDWKSLMNGRNLMAACNGTDPFKNDRILLEKMQQYGFMGIHNYPSMSFVDGNFGQNLDNLKFGFEKEIKILIKAKEIGFYTCGMVRTQKQAMQMTRAGIDVIIFYLGLGEGLERYKEERTETDIRKLKELISGVRKISKTIPLLFYDEQIQTVDEIRYIVQETGEINGYFLMPITKQNVSRKQLKLEIRQLLEIKY